MYSVNFKSKIQELKVCRAGMFIQAVQKLQISSRTRAEKPEEALPGSPSDVVVLIWRFMGTCGKCKKKKSDSVVQRNFRG